MVTVKFRQRFRSCFRTILNLNTSFLSGQKLVLKTSNGGNNWFNIWDSVGGNDKSNIVYFKNENEGWLSYPNGDKIYKTINGELTGLLLADMV